jgi:hypothetical protein
VPPHRPESLFSGPLRRAGGAQVLLGLLRFEEDAVGHGGRDRLLGPLDLELDPLGTDNPDQRIAEDIRVSTELVAKGVPVELTTTGNSQSAPAGIVSVSFTHLKCWISGGTAAAGPASPSTSMPSSAAVTSFFINRPSGYVINIGRPRVAHTSWTWPRRLMTVRSAVSVLNATTIRPEAPLIPSLGSIGSERPVKNLVWWRRPE